MAIVHVEGFSFLLLISYLDVAQLLADKANSDQEILDRINVGGKCYHPDNMLFYPIRNTALIDADSVVFEFIGSINYTLMCCMFDGTRFVNSLDHKIRSCTQNTPMQIQRTHGVRCCKFHHRISYRSGFYSFVMKDFMTWTSDTWESLTTLTARITREQVHEATKKGQVDSVMDQVVYDGFFQLHYPTVFDSVEKPIYAPSEPGKSYIRRSWQLVKGLPDVHIAVETSAVVPGVVVTCTVSNATTPRVRLYPSLEPTVFQGDCNFHTMRVRSHEPLASKLENSRATYPHFSLPQVATYVTARTWSTFPKCAFRLGPVAAVTVTARCRTSVARSQAYSDGWSANTVKLTLYNPSVEMKSEQKVFYFMDEIEFGFKYPQASSPYSLQIVIPTASEKALFQVPNKLSTVSFHKNAPQGIYRIEIRVIPKKMTGFVTETDDLIFRNVMTLNLHSLEPIIDPIAKTHYVFEIVRCRASVDRQDFVPYLRWDIGNLDAQVRSKLVVQENGTAFVFTGTIKEGHKPLTFYCRLGSTPHNMKSVKHTFKISGKPHLRLTPMRHQYHINDLLTCETDRKSYGEVILRPINLCKDEGSWCHRKIHEELRRRKASDSFTFPMYVKEAQYKIQCMIKPHNSTIHYATKMFTIQYNGVRMSLSPNKTYFGFHTEISCVPVQQTQYSIYLKFPLEWERFVQITKTGSFFVSDAPNPGWLTVFCGLSDFETKVGKNFTIFIGDDRFGRPDTQNKLRVLHGRPWEFYAYALLAGCLYNVLLLYVAFAINFSIRIHQARKACVRRFIEKYNIAAYDEVTPSFFLDLLSFACDEKLIQNPPESYHLHTTN